jgi:hypothetical protein
MGSTIYKECLKKIMDYISSSPVNNISAATILDLGSTENFPVFGAPCMNTHIAINLMEVKLPDGDCIRSTHASKVDIPALTLAARETHRFSHHFAIVWLLR